mmetsp:Transcript_95116/g.268705  ORF Transcript_95116/g.268705 Transcript_95116/m.268705 type:complete len:425 (+) Transcript_95116:91-1365(+)
MILSSSSQQLCAEISEHRHDIEAGVHKLQARRPLRWRSFVVRVLGVVVAAVACIVEGNPAFAPQAGVPDVVASKGQLTGGTLRKPRATHSIASKSVPSYQRGDVGQQDGIALRKTMEQRTQPWLRTPSTGEAVSASGFADRGFSLFLETIVHSSVWMAASLASLVPYVQISALRAIDWRPFCAGFCESLVVYTLDHLRDIRKSTPSTGRHKVGNALRIRALKVLSLAGLMGFVASVAAAPAGRHAVVGLTFGVHLVLCVAYGKLKPRMPYLKAAYVSLCVVFMSIAAPAAYEPGLLAGFSVAALMRLLLLIISISFTIENLQDLRDVREDREAGVVTLPSGLGAEWTARLLLTSQVSCVLLQVCLAISGLLPLRPDMLAIHILCSVCALGFSENTPRCLFQVILEPLYVSPLAMLLVRASLAGT